jgi:hypothetical protein
VPSYNLPNPQRLFFPQNLFRISISSSSPTSIPSNLLQIEGVLSFAVIQTTLALVSSTPALPFVSSLHSLVSTTIYQLELLSPELALQIHEFDPSILNTRLNWRLSSSAYEESKQFGSGSQLRRHSDHNEDITYLLTEPHTNYSY